MESDSSDSGLGVLHLLPLELRRQVYKILLHDVFDKASKLGSLLQTGLRLEEERAQTSISTSRLPRRLGLQLNKYIASHRRILCQTSIQLPTLMVASGSIFRETSLVLIDHIKGLGQPEILGDITSAEALLLALKKWPSDYTALVERLGPGARRPT